MHGYIPRRPTSEAYLRQKTGLTILGEPFIDEDHRDPRRGREDRELFMEMLSQHRLDCDNSALVQRFTAAWNARVLVEIQKQEQGEEYRLIRPKQASHIRDWARKVQRRLDVAQGLREDEAEQMREAHRQHSLPATSLPPPQHLPPPAQGVVPAPITLPPEGAILSCVVPAQPNQLMMRVETSTDPVLQIQAAPAPVSQTSQPGTRAKHDPKICIGCRRRIFRHPQPHGADCWYKVVCRNCNKARDEHAKVGLLHEKCTEQRIGTG